MGQVLAMFLCRLGLQLMTDRLVSIHALPEISRNQCMHTWPCYVLLQLCLIISLVNADVTALQRRGVQFNGMAPIRVERTHACLW